MKYNSTYRLSYLALMLLSQLSHATNIFKWTDTQGRQHYSDINHPAATELKLTQDYSYYPVKKVYDGDTVLLTEGVKSAWSVSIHLKLDTPGKPRRQEATQHGNG